MIKILQKNNIFKKVKIIDDSGISKWVKYFALKRMINTLPSFKELEKGMIFLDCDTDKVEIINGESLENTDPKQQTNKSKRSRKTNKRDSARDLL